MDRPPLWEVRYTLDEWLEQRTPRAATAAEAAWLAALDLADRGFGGRVRLLSVKPHPAR